MAGLLQKVAGGALRGIGQGMMDQAKQAREDAILAWTRGNQVEDRNAGFAHQDATLATTEAGADRRQGVSEGGMDRRQGVSESGQDRRQGVSEAGQDRRQGVSEAGATTRLGISEAGSDRRADKVIGAQKDRDEYAAGQYADVKPTADGSFVAMNKKGQAIPVTDPSGKPIISTNDKVPPSVSAGILRAHISVDPDTNQPVVDMPAYLRDLAAAQKHYSHQTEDSGPATFINRNPAEAQIPGAGGLTSNLFGKPAPSLGTDKPQTSAAPGKSYDDAVNMLRSNPKLQGDFDKRYGQGAAARALGK